MTNNMVRNLELHEAMVLVMLERKLRTGITEVSTSDLAQEIRERQLYFQKEGGFAEASQIGARARQYPALFSATMTDGRKNLVLNELPRLQGEVVAKVVATDS